MQSKTNAPTRAAVELRLTPRQIDTLAHPLTVRSARELTLHNAEPPSEACKLELLQAACIYVAAELGVPLNDEAERVFADRLDHLYRVSLGSRVPMRLDSFAVRMRAVLIGAKAKAMAST